MSDVTINYNGSTIATMDAVGAKKLLTKNTICDGNVAVSFTSPSSTRSVEVSYNGNVIASLTESGTKTLLVDEKYCNDDLLVSYKTSLPSEYQEVEYIESTGTQFIRSVYSFASNIYDVAVAAETQTDGKEMCLFSIAPSLTANGIETGWSSLTRVFSYQYPAGSLAYTNAPSGKLTIRAWRNNTTRYLQINDETAKSDQNPLQVEGWDLHLFYHQQKFFFIGKCYGGKIFDNNVIVRNLVPCVRLSDHKAGLFDFVEQVFFGSDGTNDFIPGDPI